MVGAKFVQNTLIMQYLITCNSSQFSIILDLLTLILLGILIGLTSAGYCLLFSSVPETFEWILPELAV